MPRKMRKKKRMHVHWVEGRRWRSRTKHPVSVKHRRVYTQFRHDMATGAYQRWLKRQGLQMYDASRERYIREVLKKR